MSAFVVFGYYYPAVVGVVGVHYSVSDSGERDGSLEASKTEAVATEGNC